VTVIGGIHEDLKSTDQDGRVYAPVPVAKQREALDFLAANVLATPDWLLDPEILRRTSQGGDVERFTRLQARFLNQLLDPGRMQRLIEAGLEPGAEAWPLPEYLDEVRGAVWADAGTPYARALQRAHVARLEWLMTEEPGFTSTPVDLATSDIRALARHQLREIAKSARELGAAGGDVVLTAHFVDVAEGIEAFLEGREVG